MWHVESEAQREKTCYETGSEGRRESILLWRPRWWLRTSRQSSEEKVSWVGRRRRAGWCADIKHFWSYSRLKGSEGERQDPKINAIFNGSRRSCWWAGVMWSTERELWASWSSWRHSRPEGKESHRSIRDVMREWMIMELFCVRRLIFRRWKRADGVTLLTWASRDTMLSAMTRFFHTRGRESTGVISIQRKTICFYYCSVWERVSGEQGFNFKKKESGSR